MQTVSVWKILLVDDDEDDYLLTRAMLAEMRGKRPELEWASTFEAGRQALAADHYDAVLMDYDLGTHTGLDLIREAMANNHPAPIILLTGRGSYEVDLEAMQAGATLYLTKSEVNSLLLERFIRYAIERKRIERERTHILESIQDGFFALDENWRFIFINHRAARNGGFEPEALIGRSIWEAFPNLPGTPLEQNYRRVMSERKSVDFEMEGVDREAWYNVSVYPLNRGISVYWQDITERKQAEQALRESEEKFRFIATNLKDILFLQDLDLRYTWIYNPANPLEESQVIGKTDADLLPQEEAERLTEIKRQVLQTGAGSKVELQLSPGGITRWYEAVYEPARDAGGQIVGVICYSRDITQPKEEGSGLGDSKSSSARIAR